MLANKHESLNACLFLLRKKLNNLAEGIRSAQYMNHRSNTEYCEKYIPTLCFHYQRLACTHLLKIACPEQFELCLRPAKGLGQLAAADWSQPN